MNYPAIYMLKWVFRFSANASCKESARKMLLALVTGDSDGYTQQYGYAGDFMKACADGNFFEAYKRADPMNRLALEMGMKQHMTNPYDDYNEDLTSKEFKGGK